jgi:ubiquinone/menaquinone biosynthesis C-methylase UbiE
MCTSYLPPICGWFALSWLRKKEYVYAVTDDKGGRAAWHGREYAPQAEHHRVLDEPFIARHPPASDAVVVDVGCGTGEFTVQLAELVPAGRVIGVDPDPSMLEQAQTKARANLEFRVGRVQQLDEVCEVASADLVVSRAMFHWIPLNEYARCYNAIFRVLKPSGWFHAESGGAGNVRAVIALLSDVAVEQGLTPARITFPDAGSVLDILEQAGFQIGDGGVTTVAQRRRFDRDQLIGFVRTQPSLAYVVGAPPEVRDAFLAAVERRVDELRRYDGTYDQTFVRLHVLGQRQ